MTSAVADGLLWEVRGPIAVLTINRPEQLNALTGEMMTAMVRLLDEFDSDPDLRVAIITGSGGRSFSAGFDFDTDLVPDFDVFFGDCAKRFFSSVYKPLIAAVNGLCTGGGLELAQGTDLRIASETATFGLGEVRWGLIPAGGSHVRLPRQIPWAVAMELLLLGERITAERAYDVGLVNRVVPPERVMEEAMAMAETLCRNAPLAMRKAKEIAVRSLALDSAFTLEAQLSRAVFESQDAREGPLAFREKREPKFVGR